jgi:hypothetical protein
LGRLTRPTETPLYNQPYLEIDDSKGFTATGNNSSNAIKIFSDNRVNIGNSRYSFSNFVVYQLALSRTETKLKAVLNPPYAGGAPELIYKIYGDNKLIYTSPIFTPNVAPQNLELDVTGYMRLKIETVLTGPNNSGFSSSSYKGIQNAVSVSFLKCFVHFCTCLYMAILIYRKTNQSDNKAMYVVITIDLPK